MGIMRLEMFLEKDVPNDYCSRVSIQELAQKYKEDTGRVPLMIVDGAYCLRTVYKQMSHEWFLGGQLKEFVAALKNFVGAFENIGVKLMFFFDGATQENKRHTWILRKEKQLHRVAVLFHSLRNGVKDHNQEFLLPPLIGAVGRFIAKYECHCEVRVSTQECDAEMADFAWRQNCFAILSRDTDFVLLRGARHYFSIERLDLGTMTTVTYDKEALLKYLSLEDHEFLLVASLLGNDIIPWIKVVHFHRQLCNNDCNNIFSVLPNVVNYIKSKNIPKDYKFECLEGIAQDIFNDKEMAKVIDKSIQSYLPPSDKGVQYTEDIIEIQLWEEIMEMVAERHMTCCLTTHLYPVMLGEAYELAVAIEDFTDRHWKPASKIYFPLRKRIYGLLLYEKPDTVIVKEWCIDNNRCPKKPRHVPVKLIENIETLHPGLLKLWSSDCDPAVRWRLFAGSLTFGHKIDAVKLQNLGFPFAVPVAVLYYLVEEDSKVLSERDIIVILIHCAALPHYSVEALNAIHFSCNYKRRGIELSTILHRGITTVLYLLAACGFNLEEAMPWHYFDGRLLHKKYCDAKSGMRDLQLCEDQESIYSHYLRMKNFIIPEVSWRIQ